MVRARLAAFVVLAVTLSCAASADVITDWNDVILNQIKLNGTPPPVASRGLAMVHIAMYDAVNSIDQAYTPYHVSAAAIPGSSREAAAATAAYNVLTNLYPTQVQTFDTALAKSLSGIPDGASKTDGINLGQYVGNQVVTWRSNDNSSKIVPYTPGTQPGEWRPTPPAYAPALLPNWPEVTPFGMESGSQFRGAGPPPLTSAEYTVDFNQTKELGAKNSAVRTADQTQIALFWADGGGTVTPPGHWNEIAQSVAATKGNTLSENARLFALMNASMADAGICAWDDKYAYNAWRPITAIQEADLDGNPLTTPDPNWEPLLTTPNFPEYVSGHSTFSGAASQILADFYGSDTFSFTTTSDGLPGVTRSFDSFSAAAAEAGISRIYGGIHFEFSNIDGLEQGSALADYIFDTMAQPVPDASTAIMFGLGLLALVPLRGGSLITRARK